MNLRELMIERIYYCVSEETLQEYFHTSEEELLTISDEDFLDLYEEVSEWVDPRTSGMSIN
jgi:hypothetical protein